jgi:hypothetical protein
MKSELEERCKYRGWLSRERVGEAGSVEDMMACAIREDDVMAVMRSLSIHSKRTMSKGKEKDEGTEEKKDEEKHEDAENRPDESDTQEQATTRELSAAVGPLTQAATSRE